MTISLRPLSLCAAFICGLSVSACSSTPKNGVVATDMTGALSQMWSNVFTGELRRAPQADYVFNNSDATLNTAMLMNRISQQEARHQHYTPQTMNYVPKLNTPQLSTENPWSRRQGNRQNLSSYESFSGQNSTSIPPVIVQPPARSQPVISDTYIERDAYPASEQIEQTASYAPASTQDWESANEEIGDDLSYVKMGGGSKISDWQSCEAEAGSYFLTTASGFVVAPGFDGCMRGKGYKPEAEAKAELAATAG